MTEKNKTPLLLTVGASATLIVGGAVAYWFLTQRNQPVGDLPVGASILPEDAVITLSLNTNGVQWEKLQEFGTPATQAAFAESLSQIQNNLLRGTPTSEPAKAPSAKSLVELRDRFLKGTGLDYQRDIQPWVGQEVTLAFLAPKAPLPTNGTPLATPTSQWSQVMVLPIANPSQARQILAQQNTQAVKWVERNYKGVQVRETQDAKTGNQYAATALDGRFLVIGNTAQVAERVIDTYKGNPALSATPGLNQALAQIQTPSPFAKIYVNVPQAAVISSENSAQPLSPDQLTQVRQNQGVAAIVSLQPEGLLFKGVSWLHPKSEKQHSTDNNARSMTERLPADTLMMVSGGNLQRLWKDYSQGQNPNAQWLKTAISQTTGLELEKDLLSWMSGEFALSMIPATTVNRATLPAAFVLMVQSSDRRNAEKNLEKLDKVMSDRYPFKVESNKIGDRPVVNWTLDVLQVTRGWLDNNVIFLTVGAPIAETLISKPVTPLATSDSFQQSVPLDLKPNNGHFYLDVDRVFNKNNPILPLRLPESQTTFFSGIRSIGVTAAIATPRISRYDILVRFYKGTQAPKPVPPSPTSKPTSTPSPSPKPETTN